MCAVRKCEAVITALRIVGAVKALLRDVTIKWNGKWDVVSDCKDARDGRVGSLEKSEDCFTLIASIKYFCFYRRRRSIEIRAGLIYQPIHLFPVRVGLFGYRR